MSEEILNTETPQGNDTPVTTPVETPVDEKVNELEKEVQELGADEAKNETVKPATFDEWLIKVTSHKKEYSKVRKLRAGVNISQADVRLLNAGALGQNAEALGKIYLPTE